MRRAGIVGQTRMMISFGVRVVPDYPSRIYNSAYENHWMRV
jgi:hypothetical protein